jgi:hypothetical protein
VGAAEPRSAVLAAPRPALFAPARGTGRGLARWWAIASGNPALDYIGTGGPTPLRLPA